MSKVLRPLGAIETRMAVMHDALGGTTQGTQICVLKGILTLSALHAAGRALSRRYQALRSVVCRDGEHLCFVETDSERPSIRHAAVEAGAGWRGAVHDLFLEELNRPLDAASALWRLLLITGPGHDDVAVVMTCHHAIMDGGALFSLADELLSYADLSMGSADIPSSDPVLLAPSVDDFLPSHSSSPPPRPAVHGCESLTHRQSVPIERRCTFVESFVLAPDDHRRLRVRAADDRVSVNALAGAAVALGFAAVGFGAPLVPLKTAVSLRQLATGPSASPSGLGCFIAVTSTPLCVEPGSTLTQLASAYQAALADAFTDALAGPTASLTQLTEKLGALTTSAVFAEGLGLTNVGAVCLRREYRHFRLIDYTGAANRRAGNVALVVSPTIFDDELRLPVTFTEPAMDRHSIREFGTSMLNQLSQYASSARI